MKVIVRVRLVEYTRIIRKFDKKEKRIKEEKIISLRPDINVPYVIEDIDYTNRTALVKIKKEDLDKIKDRILEIIGEADF